jgi:predicted nucleic acid-binding protein
MIRHVFVDTDVLLDVALAREPFISASTQVVSILENNLAIGYVSSIEIANIYYILRKFGGEEKARLFISNIVSFLTVIPVDHSDVLLGLKSDFSDFEDSLQSFSALRNRCDCIVSRNVEDYSHAKTELYTPIEFLEMYKELS